MVIMNEFRWAILTVVIGILICVLLILTVAFKEEIDSWIALNPEVSGGAILTICVISTFLYCLHKARKI